MKLKQTSYITLLLIILFSVMTNLSAQNRNSVSSRQYAKEQSDQYQYSGAERAMKEINELKSMLNERREREETQKQVLQDLQDLIYTTTGANPSSNNISQNKSSYTPQARSNASIGVKKSYNNDNNYVAKQPTTPSPRINDQAVTSGSILSKIEGQEREDYRILEQQYNTERRKADREIELLKEQLAIANRQLDNCQQSNSSQNHQADYYPNTNTPSFNTQSSASNFFEDDDFSYSNSQQQQPLSTTKPAAKVNSSSNEAAMEDIRQMRDMLLERRKQQDSQRQLLQELQNQLNSAKFTM